MVPVGTSRRCPSGSARRRPPDGRSDATWRLLALGAGRIPGPARSAPGAALRAPYVCKPGNHPAFSGEMNDARAPTRSAPAAAGAPAARTGDGLPRAPPLALAGSSESRRSATVPPVVSDSHARCKYRRRAAVGLSRMGGRGRAQNDPADKSMPLSMQMLPEYLCLGAPGSRRKGEGRYSYLGLTAPGALLPGCSAMLTVDNRFGIGATRQFVASQPL